jgi:antiviral helicase SKI2
MVRICDSLYTETKYDGEFAKYPYPLSDFQKYAIEGIIEGQHVLVTAHTGSGKTLPAEFAIQHFVLERGKKVIYTSPIKALSNQKFYEFSLKYPNISFGLLTGDIKTNPNADVLIMTTEILMNYLFARNSQNTSTELSFQIDIENELACVVFDEVHYINDADRGQTWEQTILMLPYHIQMVMLSATIDNPAGFATWIENRDSQYIDGRKSVYLASTNHRVVPLTHYGFFATSETPFKNIKDKTIQQQIRDATNKLILMKTSNGKFNDAGYYEIKTMADLFAKNQFYMKRKFVLNRLMEFLKQEEMLPAIVFVFSRKSVEQCAHDITTNLLEDDSKNKIGKTIIIVK